MSIEILGLRVNIREDCRRGFLVALHILEKLSLSCFDESDHMLSVTTREDVLVHSLLGNWLIA